MSLVHRKETNWGCGGAATICENKDKCANKDKDKIQQARLAPITRPYSASSIVVKRSCASNCKQTRVLLGLDTCNILPINLTHVTMNLRGGDESPSRICVMTKEKVQCTPSLAHALVILSKFAMDVW